MAGSLDADRLFLQRFAPAAAVVLVGLLRHG